VLKEHEERYLMRIRGLEDELEEQKNKFMKDIRENQSKCEE
jgi:hypothetical protein